MATVFPSTSKNWAENLTSGLEQYISGCNSPFHVKKSLSKLHSFMSIGHDAISLRNLLKKTFRSFVEYLYLNKYSILAMAISKIYGMDSRVHSKLHFQVLLFVVTNEYTLTMLSWKMIFCRNSLKIRVIKKYLDQKLFFI